MEVASTDHADVAVIGAGSSGLAVLKALREHDFAVDCFERGADVGGLWRYENDSGLSGAYASLHTNASRLRMQYPSFPMPGSYGDFPHHTEMAAYLDAYAEAYGLRELIQFSTIVERLEPSSDGGWWITLNDGSSHSYGAVAVATGIFWRPRLPTYPGGFDGEVSHAHHYRVPDRFGGRRVLVVGTGPSAGEIAVEVSTVAQRTFMSVRRGAYVIPRWLGGMPFDAGDVEPLNRLPWRLLNRIYRRRVTREMGPAPASWPLPAHRFLEGIPIVSSDLFPAVRRGEVLVKPAIERLSGGRVRFVDGSEERVDSIVYATGYRVSLPFLSSSLLAASGRDFPLYRRIAPPEVGGLYFAGFVDTPGGLLPVVETQGDWIATVLTGRMRLPPPAQMRRAIKRAERRTRQRFPDESPHSIRCDPHAYRRLLKSDLRRARRRCGAQRQPRRQEACDSGALLETSRGRLPTTRGQHPSVADLMKEPINLAQKLALFDERYSPRIVATMNDYKIEVVKVEGEFVWHSHPDTDDFFLVLEGELEIELRDRTVRVGKGELFVVPRGVEHRPRAGEEAHILLIEPQGTANTGDAVDSELTAVERTI
jgi:dimethylaniline monooxygenase (N-oxide forming)